MRFIRVSMRQIIPVFVATLCTQAISNADVIVLNPIADAMVDVNNPNTNFGSTTSMTLLGGNTTAGLFKFDLSSLPSGSTIDSLQFRFYVTSQINQPFFEFKELVADWDEGEVTWNNASVGVPWATAGGGVTGAQLGNDDILATEVGTYQKYASTPDFVALAQDWLDNPSANYGFRLHRFPGDASRSIELPSSEASLNLPELQVTYTVPEPGSLALMGLAALVAFPRRRTAAVQLP